MRGKITSDEKIEEIKALSAIYPPKIVAERICVSLRTVYEVRNSKDSDNLEAYREKRRLKLAEKAWDKAEDEALELKAIG